MQPSAGTGLTANIAENVAGAWFPINKTVLEEIRGSLKSGRYNHNIQSLIQDIKTDSSLYMLCLKKLAAQVKDQLVESTPPLIFETAGFDALKSVLLSQLEVSVPHRFDTMTELQAARLKESMISASTAEVLAEHGSVNGELGFSCALLRQLGLTLVAWNYPHVYARALQTLTETNSNLDLEIQKILGFSPSSLAIVVTKDWGLAASIKSAINQTENKDELSEDQKKVTDVLISHCKIGEALARASDPENYPSAMSDWKDAETAIKAALGNDGVKLVQNRISQNLKAYINRSPELFRVPVAEDLKDKIDSSNFAKQLLEENKYVELCPPLLQLQIKELYSSFSPSEISRENIQKLIKEIIPSAGFDRGCVYMFEPSTTTLVPLLKIGNLSESRLQSITISALNLDSNPVATAFRCNTPIKQSEQGPHGTNIITLSGALGGNQKAGVLYLEVSDRLVKKPKIEPEVYFKAIRQCLNHCLGLR